MNISWKNRLTGIISRIHYYLLFGEKGDMVAWIIFSILFGIYMGFSLSLTRFFGSTLILEYTDYAHDLFSHLYIAKNVIDNGYESKLANLGTVWLPLYHLILLPFVKLNSLYYTGLAGAIVNSIMQSAIGSTIYLIIKGRTGVIAALLYGTLTYSLIHASSSYMVVAGIYFSIIGIFYFQQYIQNHSYGHLIKSIFLFMLASITRYETWPLLVGVTLIILFKERKKKPTFTASLIFPLYWGIIGWLIYNKIIFGDMFEFVNIKAAGAYGYYSQLIKNTMTVYLWKFEQIINIIYNLMGPLIVLLPIGLSLLLFSKDKKIR